MFTVEYDILDELQMGDNKMRLGQSISKAKNLVILSWSSLSNQWNVSHRYGDIQGEWDKWKKLSKR